MSPHICRDPEGEKERFGVIAVLRESTAPVLLGQQLHGAGETLRRYPTSKGKGKPQQDGRRGKIAFRIKPHSCQRLSEGWNKPCAHQDPETPQRLRQNGVWALPEGYRSAVDSCGDSGSGCGYGINPLGGGCHWSTRELPELTQDWEIDSWRHKQNLVHQDPGERSRDPTRDWPRLARECPGVSSGGAGHWWPAAGLEAVSVAGYAWDLVKEVTIRSPASSPPQLGLRSNNREGTQPHPSTENWIKNLLSMALRIRTRTSFPLSQSLPSGSSHKPLNLLHQRADRLKTTIPEN